MKILFYDTKPYDRESFEAALSRYEDVTVDFLLTNISERTVSLAKGYDAVCVFVSSDMNRRILTELADLGVRLILLRCAGFNNVDLDCAKELSLTVMRVPGYSPEAVAEHALALAFAVNRHIHKAYIKVRENNFSLLGLTGVNFFGKTAGIIGTGKIGAAMARFCHGLGMKVIAYDKYENPELDFLRYVSLDELFRESDLISLHCPLTKETYHIIDLPAIEKMKDGVILVNTSRGALVDAEALLTGIKARTVGAACLDVYEEESDLFFEDNSGHILEDDTLARLISMPNVIVTSHQAFLTNEALTNIAETTLQNLINFFRYGQCPNELCYRCGSAQDCLSKKCF